MLVRSCMKCHFHEAKRDEELLMALDGHEADITATYHM